MQDDSVTIRDYNVFNATNSNSRGVHTCYSSSSRYQIAVAFTHSTFLGPQLLPNLHLIITKCYCNFFFRELIWKTYEQVSLINTGTRFGVSLPLTFPRRKNMN